MSVLQPRCRHVHFRVARGHARCGCASACRRSDRMSSFLVLLHLFLLPYQLALITPGTSPASASCRKQMRHSLNFRRKPARPPAAEAAVAMPALQLGRLRGLGDRQFFVSRNFRSSGHDISFTAAERHSQVLQQRQTLRIGLGGGGDANIHSLGFLDFVVVDLRENQLILQCPACSCRGRRRTWSKRRGNRARGAAPRSPGGPEIRTCGRRAASPCSRWACPRAA